MAKLAEWQKLAHSISKMSEGERRQRLRELTLHYGWDVAGNFNPRVFRVSTRLLPPLVTGLLAPSSLIDQIRDPARLVSLEALDDKVVPAALVKVG